ncbi:MAG TPA: response regulator transcription factor [Coriobacteriia bacterium]|nr:response regulator transcription factor [Coriobacteriia bacterium]
MNILLVEDEERIAAFVNKGLSAEGHSVEHVATASEAISIATTHDFDVVLLDLVLPDGSGKQVLQSIRRIKPELPVIVVSALGEIDDKVDLLDLGANDYLVKPFAFAELAARIRAVARTTTETSRVLTAGDLCLDTRTRVATRGNTSADLPSREFALLEYLMRHPGQVLTRQQILDAVWGISFDTDSNVVDVYVGYLRRKLDGVGEDSAIETVRGAGYRVRA